MDTQTIINIVIMLFGLMLGYLLRQLESSMDSLRKADADLTAKIQAIEVLVAGEYVKHEALKDALAPITTQLNRIENKLDGKEDKK